VLGHLLLQESEDGERVHATKVRTLPRPNRPGTLAPLPVRQRERGSALPLSRFG
jgi:hypothetical protein